MQNQRKRTRVHGQYEGEIAVAGRVMPVYTDNLSLKGALCRFEEPDVGTPPDPDTPCRLFIRLAPAVQLSLDGTVVRADAETLAMDFTGMDGDSYAHLRNIVRLLSGDADAIDREQTAVPFSPQD